MTTMRPFSRWRTARRRIHGSATWSIWIADMTRVNNPSFSSACWSARLLMTVASMPMWSAATRSMPSVLADRPRKMLPPPRTMPTWTPSACTSFTSCASPARISSAMPCPASPASSSPESLSRMRCGFALNASLRAQAEPHESPHDDVLARLRRDLPDQVADRLLVVLDERLLHEAHLGVELVELAIHDLVHDRGRFALVLHLLGVDRALARDALGGHVFAPHVVGARRRGLHGEVLAERLEVVRARDEVGLAVHLDEHADPAVVHVGLDATLGGRPVRALLRLRDARLAERVDRLLEVARGLRQRLLALHHARPGHVPELLDLFRRDRHGAPLLVGTPARSDSRPGAWKSGSRGLRRAREPRRLRPRPRRRRTRRSPGRR